MVKPKRLGHVVIRVRDLARSQKFYADVLGLNVTAQLADRMVFMSAAGDSSHELALMAVGEDAPGPEADRVGLYHFAWEMESFDDLRRIHRELGEKNVPIGGMGDHGISMGVYFFDPDGNEIEVFYELPRDQWPDENIFFGKFPMSLEEPAAEAV
jgi:catechol-2,3-dioxygenase